MKSSQTDGQKRRPWGWVIDPIKSFFPNASGYQDALFIPAGLNESPFEDDILWEAGKRAFDIIHDRCGHEAETKEGLEKIICCNTDELLKFYNGIVEEFNSQMGKGWLQITDEETGQPYGDLQTLDADPNNKYGGLYKLESSFWAIDTIFETLALRGSEISIPYDREFVAALFTLVHVDDSALGHVFSDCHGPDAHTWATRWFEKLYNFERAQKAIKERDAQIQRAKSQSMNVKRHAQRNEAKELVTADWSERKSEFRSAAKAGLYYEGWLQDRGFEYEPTTITGWIRKYAKENGIKLR